jgi:hypothetical protein
MYQICQYAINKAQNGYLTPSQFNLLANQAQTSFQDYLLGEFQQYQYGRPQARVNYSQNSDTRQRLTPFIVETIQNPSTDGVVNYPDDYLQIDSVRTENFDRIRFVQQDSLYSYIKSEIDPIATNPIYLLNETGFKFYPNLTDNDVDLSNVWFTYVKSAPEMKWGYSYDSNNRPVYNPTTWSSFYAYKGTNPTNPCTLTNDPHTLYYEGPLVLNSTVFKNAIAGSIANSGYYLNTYTKDIYTVNGSGVFVGISQCATPPATVNTTNYSTYSAQPLWYDVDKLEIIARILKLVGVSLQDGQVEQYANMVTTQGQ